jgi:hypothetical protein
MNGVVNLVLEREGSAAGRSRAELLFGARVAGSIWCKFEQNEGIRRGARYRRRG